MASNCWMMNWRENAKRRYYGHRYCGILGTYNTTCGFCCGLRVIKLCWMLFRHDIFLSRLITRTEKEACQDGNVTIYLSSAQSRFGWSCCGCYVSVPWYAWMATGGVVFNIFFILDGFLCGKVLKCIMHYCWSLLWHGNFMLLFSSNVCGTRCCRETPSNVQPITAGQDADTHAGIGPQPPYQGFPSEPFHAGMDSTSHCLGSWSSVYKSDRNRICSNIRSLLSAYRWRIGAN